MTGISNEVIDEINIRSVIIAAKQHDLQRILATKLPRWIEHFNHKEYTFTTLKEILETDSSMKFAALTSEPVKFVSARHLNGSYAVIWEAGRYDANWFERLEQEGYKGMKIMLANQDVQGHMHSHADTVIRIPQLDGLIEIIYNALTMEYPANCRMAMEKIQQNELMMKRYEMK